LHRCCWVPRFSVKLPICLFVANLFIRFGLFNSYDRNYQESPRQTAEPPEANTLSSRYNFVRLRCLYRRCNHLRRCSHWSKGIHGSPGKVDVASCMGNLLDHSSRLVFPRLGHCRQRQRHQRPRIRNLHRFDLHGYRCRPSRHVLVAFGKVGSQDSRSFGTHALPYTMVHRRMVRNLRNLLVECVGLACQCQWNLLLLDECVRKHLLLHWCRHCLCRHCLHLTHLEIGHCCPGRIGDPKVNV